MVKKDGQMVHPWGVATDSCNAGGWLTAIESWDGNPVLGWRGGGSAYLSIAATYGIFRWTFQASKRDGIMRAHPS